MKAKRACTPYRGASPTSSTEIPRIPSSSSTPSLRWQLTRVLMELVREVNIRVVCGHFGQTRSEGSLVISLSFSGYSLASNITLTMESYRNMLAEGVMEKAKRLCGQHGDVSNLPPRFKVKMVREKKNAFTFLFTCP